MAAELVTLNRSWHQQCTAGNSLTEKDDTTFWDGHLNGTKFKGSCSEADSWGGGGGGLGVATPPFIYGNAPSSAKQPLPLPRFLNWA